MLGNVAMLGACGSGKTYTLQLLVRHAVERTAWSALVLDLNREWPDRGVWRGCDVDVARVSTVERARERIAEGWRVVVVRPSFHDDDMGKDNYAADVANELARIAVESPSSVALVLPEVHWSAREGRALPPWIGRIVHQWRHVGALVWCDSQNPVDVRKELLRGMGSLYVFRVGGWQDYETLRRIGGPPLEGAARKLGSLAERHGPGWHLRVAPGVDPSSWEAFRVSRDGAERRALV